MTSQRFASENFISRFSQNSDFLKPKDKIEKSETNIHRNDQKFLKARKKICKSKAWVNLKIKPNNKSKLFDWFRLNYLKVSIIIFKQIFTF